MSGLTRLNIDSLNVGDVVGLTHYPSYGWNRKFRYPVVSERKIERITPKRNKFVLEGGIELDRQEASTCLVVCDAEAKRQSDIAKIFNKTTNLMYKLKEAERRGSYIIEQKLTDDELSEYCAMLSSICSKYIPAEEK